MSTSGQGPSDFRFTAFDFNPTKYDAMMSSFDNARDRVKNIPDLLNVRVVRTLENRMIVMSVWVQEQRCAERSNRSSQFNLC